MTEGDQGFPRTILCTVHIKFVGLGLGMVLQAALAFTTTLLLQGVLPVDSAEGTAGLLGLHPLLRRLCLRHREQQEEGGRGGGAGEPRRKCLQHGPQHLLLQKPPVRQLDPQGEAAGGDPGLSRGTSNPSRMRKPCPKPEPKNVSIPHKSDMFMGLVSKHLRPFQLSILEIQKCLNFKSLKKGQMQMKLFPSLFFYSSSLKILDAHGQVPVRDEFLQLRYNSWKYGLITGMRSQLSIKPGNATSLRLSPG